MVAKVVPYSEAQYALASVHVLVASTAIKRSDGGGVTSQPSHRNTMSLAQGRSFSISSIVLGFVAPLSFMPQSSLKSGLSFWTPPLGSPLFHHFRSAQSESHSYPDAHTHFPSTFSSERP